MELFRGVARGEQGADCPLGMLSDRENWEKSAKIRGNQEKSGRKGKYWEACPYVLVGLAIRP